jgi:hypothetical protein
MGMTKKDLYKNKEFNPFKTEREEKGDWER